MFRNLVAQTTTLTNPARDLVKLSPTEITALLERYWNARSHDITKGLGHPNRRSDVPGLGDLITAPLVTPAPGTPPSPPTVPATPVDLFLTSITSKTFPLWEHLIYAYMIENTRIYEIFRRVVHEYLHGEKLGVPQPETQLWLRNTEELFFRDAPPFFVGTVDSHIRSDMRASRRNAYQRMFGMDLNHGKDDNTPYPYLKSEVANNGFVNTFEELLREVWVGIVHVSSTSAPRPTDNAKIENLASRLHDMLITRRLSGNLSREEFAFVSMMSWFHLTVESDLPVVFDLKAEASTAGPEQRLFKIAQRVGLPAHGLSESYFDIADAISAVLILIETGLLNASGAGQAFYDPAAAALLGVPITLPDTMNTIITHWTAITGRDVKAGKVAAS